MAGGTASQGSGGEEPHEEEEVTPAEDLMREHGVLERVLLVYETAALRLGESDHSALPVLVHAADLVRRFVEDYHERLEEQHLFPRLQQAGPLAETVTTLRLQHERGRALTDEIRRSAAAGGQDALAPDGGLVRALRVYIRMYRPHAAREDTVVFPAFRELVTRETYEDLGRQFEEKEHALFGEGGFQTIVGQVAELEKALGIYDLAQFTP